MFFLKNPHLDLTKESIETTRCLLLPFSKKSWEFIEKVREEFLLANRNLWISPFTPTFEEEARFFDDMIEKIENREVFECYIFDKLTKEFLGCAWLNSPEEKRMNIGIWIKPDKQGKWYGTEVYEALICWAREHTVYSYLKHSNNPENRASAELAKRFWGILQDEKTENNNDIYHIPF